jgi:hypothetical protein
MTTSTEGEAEGVPILRLRAVPVEGTHKVTEGVPVTVEVSHNDGADSSGVAAPEMTGQTPERPSDYEILAQQNAIRSVLNLSTWNLSNLSPA